MDKEQLSRMIEADTDYILGLIDELRDQVEQIANNG
jgi:hypothetical protein